MLVVVVLEKYSESGGLPPPCHPTVEDSGCPVAPTVFSHSKYLCQWGTKCPTGRTLEVIVKHVVCDAGEA